MGRWTVSLARRTRKVDWVCFYHLDVHAPVTPPSVVPWQHPFHPFHPTIIPHWLSLALLARTSSSAIISIETFLRGMTFLPLLFYKPQISNLD